MTNEQLGQFLGIALANQPTEEDIEEAIRWLASHIQKENEDEREK